MAPRTDLRKYSKDIHYKGNTVLDLIHAINKLYSLKERMKMLEKGNKLAANGTLGRTTEYLEALSDHEKVCWFKGHFNEAIILFNAMKDDATLPRRPVKNGRWN